MLLNLEALRAEETLREHGSQLTADSLREQVLLATGDEREADKAWSKRSLEQLRQETG